MSFRIRLPNYQQSLVNLTASILNYFGVSCDYQPLALCNPFLKEQDQTIILLVLDGLGSEVLDQCYPRQNSFFHRHNFGTYLSTFPPTTTAAITTLLSGKTPLETGWLGWHQYFHEIDQDIILFTNKNYYDSSKSITTFSSYQTLPYENIFDKLEKKGINTARFMPMWDQQYGVKDITSMCQSILHVIKDGFARFVYAYWDQPDHSLHDYGVGSKEVSKVVCDLEQHIAELAANLPPSATLFVTADHGHINVKGINLHQDQDLMAMLYRLPSIEARATAFFVNKEYHTLFRSVFNKRYGNLFKLLSYHEVIHMNLLGMNTPHFRLAEFVGDFLAVAIDTYCFYYDSKKKKSPVFKATHAGLTHFEMNIPLVVVSSKKSQE